jgi:hypothetical protein
MTDHAAEHPVDVMLAEADSAIERMKAFAIEARRLHARSELARHMRTTALKLIALPVDHAAAALAREWMKAWSLEGGYDAIGAAISAFAMAFCRDVRGSDAATQAALSDAFAALEAGFASLGTSLSDEMAFRSECAHGWWSLVVPPPAAGGKPPGGLPPVAGQPFWSVGPQPHCLGSPPVR